MRSIGKAGITACAVLTFGCLTAPGVVLAQFGGMFGGGGGTLGGGGLGGGGLGGFNGGGGWGAPGGRGGLGSLISGARSANAGQNGWGPSGSMYPNSGWGYNQQGGMAGYGQQGGGYFNPNNIAPNNIAANGYNSPSPYVQPPAVSSNPGQPYRATDGNWYSPDGRLYSAPAAPAPRPVTAAKPAAPAAPPPATPATNVIPDLPGFHAIVDNTVRTQLPSAPSRVQEDLAQQLTRLVDEGIERLEGSLRNALFSEDDEDNFLAIYRRDYSEDTPQFRLARKNIKDLDAGELRQGLLMDSIQDSMAHIYPAKLEVSAMFEQFKRALHDEPPSSGLDRVVKGLLKTYEAIARSPEFSRIHVPDIDQVRSGVDRLRQVIEVRQRLAEPKEPATGGMITMDKRLRIVRYSGLPRDTVQAIDPQTCLWGKGFGPIEIQDAELVDLGVPLLNPLASPVADTPRPTPYTGTLVLNPKVNPVKVNYVIDGVSYELKPGDSRSHKITTKSQITYNRNPTLGNVTYRLTAGTYRFSIQARAWQIQKASYTFLVDNSANACEFHCEIDGRPRVISPRKTLQVTSAYPLSIRFDKGNGQAIASKLLGETNTVTVGVAPGSLALDLFPGKSQDLAVRPLSLESIATQSSSAKPGRQTILPTIEEMQRAFAIGR